MKIFVSIFLCLVVKICNSQIKQFDGYVITTIGLMYKDSTAIRNAIKRSNYFYVENMRNLWINNKIYSNCAANYRVDEILLRSNMISIGPEILTRAVLAGCCLNHDSSFFLKDDSVTAANFNKLESEFRTLPFAWVDEILENYFIVRYKRYYYVITVSKVQIEGCVCKNALEDVYMDAFNPDRFRDKVLMLNGIKNISKSKADNITLAKYVKKMLRGTKWK